MTRYEWHGSGSLRRPDEEFVEPGETFEPTEDELRSFGDLIEAVEPEADEDVEGASADASDDTADGSDDAETYTCAGTTAGDEPCTREVDEPGGYCYQHGPD